MSEKYYGRYTPEEIKSLTTYPGGRDTKMLNSCLFPTPHPPKKDPNFKSRWHSKYRQSSETCYRQFFSNSIFLLTKSHLRKELGSKSKCNYSLPQEGALNTFLLYCQALGLQCKSEKVISKASFIHRNGNGHLYATNKSIKGGKELEMAFIAVMNFRECSSWWLLNPASSCHPPGAKWRKIKHGTILTTLNTKSAHLTCLLKWSKSRAEPDVSPNIVGFGGPKLRVWSAVWVAVFLCVWVYINLDAGNYFNHPDYFQYNNVLK